MSIITKGAEYLAGELGALCVQKMSRGVSMEEAVRGVTKTKSFIFNICTVSLIASVVFGLCGLISTANTLALGAVSYFGRRVADESFNVSLPSVLVYCFPNICKPDPLLAFGRVVIFYDSR